MARKAAQRFPDLPQMPAEELERTWKQFFASDRADVYRNLLVEHYRYIVRYHAERLHHTLPEGVELDDMVSAGIFGLMDALRRFDVDRGVKFETYCVPRIRGAMIDSLREMDWIPRLVRSKASKVNRAREEFDETYGRPPTIAELAKALHMKVKELEHFIEEARPVELISLHKQWYETDNFRDVREIDLLKDHRAERPTARYKKLKFMQRITKGMNRNERLIVLLYYYEEQTMKEIGKTLDLSESRVSQMHSSIMAKLQMAQRKEDLQAYLVP